MWIELLRLVAKALDKHRENSGIFFDVIGDYLDLPKELHLKSEAVVPKGNSTFKPLKYVLMP